MTIPRDCLWCHKSFLPKEKKQKYCSKSHKVRACQTRKAEKGDIRVVKFCIFKLESGYTPGQAQVYGYPLFYRCSLESGHRGDHLIRIANEADAVLDSKTGS